MIISSQFQTKEWRKGQKWYKGGKSVECEKNQLECINVKNIGKCDERINQENYEIEINRYPFSSPNGYEYTENFDGKINIDEYSVYFNLKFVCGRGGAQTRTLKNVYSFIKYQHSIIYKYTNTIFVNILDGDESFRNMNKFIYLKKNKPYLKYICYVGNLFDFKIWWLKIICLMPIKNQENIQLKLTEINLNKLKLNN
jgi:hypothetical protein